MLGLPKPYPNELLYSVLARAGVHEGETSPKQLLDSIFANRKVIATIDLPCHVECIALQYPVSLNLSASALIKDHTLWPIYAPFIPFERRKAIEEWMSGESRGAAHLAAGVAASRVRAKQKLLLCKTCREESEKIHGEAFWDRRWQVPLVFCCPLHGPLSETDINLNGEHRHTFVPISQREGNGNLSVTKSDIRFAELVYGLFDVYAKESPSYQQWTQLYRNLAFSYGFFVGKRIDHQRLHHHYVHYWGKEWLEKADLLPSSRDSSWLKCIFRKHRKAFSFAEHLTAVEAISEGQIQIRNAIEQTLDYRIDNKEPKHKGYVITGGISNDQREWVSLLDSRTPKLARQLQPALYARLYRNHYHWLMHANGEHHQPANNVNNRVDWTKRDRKASRKLLSIIEQSEDDLSTPRLTRAFLIHRLINHATIEKNLFRLPRCRAILKRYSESIDEYQARRLTRALIEMRERKQAKKKWILLRKAGLSEGRMTDVVKSFLIEIFKDEV